MFSSIIRVVLVDGDANICRNLREWLAQTNDIRVMAEVNDERQVLELVAQHQPDVVIIATQLPHSQRSELIRQLRTGKSTAGILILLLSEDAPSVKAALDDGANGYVLASAPVEEIVEAVRVVQEANQTWVQIRRCSKNNYPPYDSHSSIP